MQPKFALCLKNRSILRATLLTTQHCPQTTATKVNRKWRENVHLQKSKRFKETLSTRSQKHAPLCVSLVPASGRLVLIRANGEPCRESTLHDTGAPTAASAKPRKTHFLLLVHSGRTSKGLSQFVRKQTGLDLNLGSSKENF